MDKTSQTLSALRKYFGLKKGKQITPQKLDEVLRAIKKFEKIKPRRVRKGKRLAAKRVVKRRSVRLTIKRRSIRRSIKRNIKRRSVRRSIKRTIKRRSVSPRRTLTRSNPNRYIKSAAKPSSVRRLTRSNPVKYNTK